MKLLVVGDILMKAVLNFKNVAVAFDLDFEIIEDYKKLSPTFTYLGQRRACFNRSCLRLSAGNS